MKTASVSGIRALVFIQHAAIMLHIRQMPFSGSRSRQTCKKWRGYYHVYEGTLSSLLNLIKAAVGDMAAGKVRADDLKAFVNILPDHR
jgi:hypothetical protein